MREQKYILALSAGEYRLLIHALLHWRNKLLAEGRYTDPIDELLLKLHRRCRHG